MKRMVSLSSEQQTPVKKVLLQNEAGEQVVAMVVTKVHLLTPHRGHTLSYPAVTELFSSAGTKRAPVTATTHTGDFGRHESGGVSDDGGRR